MDESQQRLAELLWPRNPPSRLIPCRHCRKKNRVSIPTAVLDSQSCRCGACGEALFLGRDEPLDGLASAAYEHALDRNSLKTLRSLPGFPALLRWILANVNERMFHLYAMSSTVACGDQQFPELVALLDLARTRLGITVRPAIFLGESPFMNAMTMGVKDPVIVVKAALLDQMDDQEVVAILAHEMGHLHADHILYQTMARLLFVIGSLRSAVVSAFSMPLQLALYKWARCAELTADRASLLGSRDLRACLQVHLKLAGGFRPGTNSRTRLKLGPFIEQARKLENAENSSRLDNLFMMLLTMNRSHPFATWRIMHLLQWVENGSFLDILAGNYARTPAPGEPVPSPS